MKKERLIESSVYKHQKWPIPEYDDKNQPHILFVLSPPYSGSTALTRILNTSNHTMILQPDGEGQWLIPGLSGENRWDPDMYVNYQSVKAVWLNKYQKISQLVGDIDVVIEKSPPNIMRIEKLSSMFRYTSFLANNRDPYANCASVLYRTPTVGKMKAEQRKEVLVNLARKWVIRSKKIEEWTRLFRAPLLTYEEFCRDTTLLLDKLNIPQNAIDTIDLQASVKVKDYPKQRISNQNDRQISNLSKTEIGKISTVLSPESKLLEFFGYQVR